MNAHFWCGNSTIVPSTLPLSVTPYQNLPKWFGAASSFFPRNMSCHSFYSLPKVPEVEWSLKISRKNWPTSANSATSILLMGQIASNFRQVTLTTSVPHPSCLWFLSPPCPEKIHLDHSHSPGSPQRRKPWKPPRTLGFLHKATIFYVVSSTILWVNSDWTNIRV